MSKILVNELAHTNNTSALTVDSSGRVKAPQTPVFMAICQTQYSMTQTYTELIYEIEDIDIGGNYNHTNGRFTAPVDGLYEFAFASIGMQNATVFRYRLRINGSDPSDGLREQRLDNSASGGSAYPHNNEYCAYLNLTAGQYVSVFHRVDSGSVNGYADSSYRYVYFRGKLII